MLSELQSRGYQVGYRDYAEDCIAEPELKIRIGNGFGPPAAYILKKLLMAQRQYDHMVVFDRLPIASYIYQIIYDESRWYGSTPYFTRMDIFGDRISDDLYEWLKSQKVLVFITDEDPKIVLARVKKRNNGIDVMTEEYIMRQNIAFQMLADEFVYVLYRVKNISDLKEMIVKEDEEEAQIWGDIKFKCVFF